jgi:RimJ/RimL family protein N-acetyltransferase
MATKQFHHNNTVVTSDTHPIYLRNIQLEDAQNFIAVLGLEPGRKPMELETARNVITRQKESVAEPSVLSTADNVVLSGPTRVNLVLMLKKNAAEGEGEDTLIGLGGYGAIKTWERDGRKVRAGDAGVVVAEDQRGKGYAVEAMKMAIDWAFRPLEEGGLQLDIVTITTGSGNAPMIKLTDEKLGLKGKGIIRDGEFEDKEVYYELTQDTWLAASELKK